jgi:EmrB/QacA subfamily drug resistance transporter
MRYILHALNQVQDDARLDPRVWKIAIVAALGPFLSQLDATVTNVSLSTLGTELHVGLSMIQWVTSGYLLALALVLPLNAWLVERIGIKNLYLGCFAGFTLSSLLCAISWSANSLIGFRVLQGISGGLMAPMAQLTMAKAAGKHLVRVVGYVSIPVLLGPILGPVIAGAILQHASWRWIFLINLPVGILAIILAILFLPRDYARTMSGRDLDVVGLLLLSPSLVLFLYGSDHLSERTGIIALLFAAGLFTVFLGKALQKGQKALIDLELFRHKVFSASAITQFAFNGLLFAGQMLIPFYLIRAGGESPSATGWLMAPMGLGMMCTYPSLGRLTRYFGIRGTSAGGALIALLGTLPFLYLSSHRHQFALLAVALFVRGLGLSAVGIPSISAALASVKDEELPMATTALNIVQRLGGPTLTTICASFLGWRLAAAHAQADIAGAFTLGFGLLCCLHILLVLAALRLPLSIDRIKRSVILEPANVNLEQI